MLFENRFQDVFINRICSQIVRTQKNLMVLEVFQMSQRLLDESFQQLPTWGCCVKWLNAEKYFHLRKMIFSMTYSKMSSQQTKGRKSSFEEKNWKHWNLSPFPAGGWQNARSNLKMASMHFRLNRKWEIWISTQISQVISGRILQIIAE